MVLSNITPGADFRTGEGELFEQGERILKKYEEANKTNLIRRAQQRGAVEGAAVADGAPMPERGFLFTGDVAEARTAALQSAYTARVRTDFDTREAQVRQQFRYDPEDYEAEMGRVRSGFIQGAPPEFAVDVETYAGERVQRGLESVSSARMVRDDQEVVQALTVRHAQLSENLIALSARGDTDSMEFFETQAELIALQDQREANPAILYSTEQRIADDERVGDSIMMATIVAEAIKTYSDAGRGRAGVAAASRFFQDEVLNGEEFADVDPGRLAKMHRDALTEFNAHTVADRDRARLEDEEERQRRAARREAASSAALDASLGALSEAEILADEGLDDAGRSRALAARRAYDSRQRSEAATARALEAANDTAIYEQFRDPALAGTLDLGELADAVNSGLVSPGRAQTLRTMNDRTLRPLVDDVMAPVRDAGERRRRLVRDFNVRMNAAEDGAAEWVRQNPNATPAQRTEAGRWYAERHFGAGANSPAAGGETGGETPAGDQARVARIRAVNEQIRARAAAGRPYSAAEANRMRAEAQGR
jgi:hypothetical protein